MSFRSAGALGEDDQNHNLKATSADVVVGRIDADGSSGKMSTAQTTTANAVTYDEEYLSGWLSDSAMAAAWWTALINQEAECLPHGAGVNLAALGPRQGPPGGCEQSSSSIACNGGSSVPVPGSGRAQFSPVSSQGDPWEGGPLYYGVKVHSHHAGSGRIGPHSERWSDSHSMYSESSNDSAWARRYVTMFLICSHIESNVSAVACREAEVGWMLDLQSQDGSLAGSQPFDVLSQRSVDDGGSIDDGSIDAFVQVRVAATVVRPYQFDFVAKCLLGFGTGHWWWWGWVCAIDGELVHSLFHW